MGNCFSFHVVNDTENTPQAVDELSDTKTIVSRSESSNLFSTSGISRGNSNGGVLSVSSSSAGQSQISVVAAADAVRLDGEILPAANLKEYSFTELKSSTNNFKTDMVLGIGGFGTVFKGWVDKKTLAPSKIGSGMIVAIKKLNHDSVQGLAEWQSEVNFLGRLSHPNLVKLLGYCYDENELLLVYEFMPKGSLENHLFRRSSITEAFSWDVRLRIAIGAARGLTFLHNSEKTIIYRDFKASNILLDENYNAKISDFGLAKQGPSGEKTHVSTRIMGTYGYAAPEYVATGHLYVKSDVYGFGVVLLEMLTGLRALDNRRPREQISLVDWLKPQLSHKNTRYLKSKTKTIMDVRMEGQYSSKAALEVVQLTLRCLESEPRKRPSMSEVVEVLEQIQTMRVVPQVSTPKSMHSSGGDGHSRHQPRRNGFGR